MPLTFHPEAILPKLWGANRGQCRILVATVIMQWPGPRRLSRNRRRNSFVLGPILPSGIGFCPRFRQRSVSDTRLHNSRRKKCAALGNLARDRLLGGPSGHRRALVPRKSRLKTLPRGDPGHDWLPHNSCGIAARMRSKRHYALAGPGHSGRVGSSGIGESKYRTSAP